MGCNKCSGFTLLELLIVMVIIGLIVGVVGPRYFGQLSKSEVKAAKAQMHALRKAIDVYRLDNGVYPDAQTGLTALVVAPPEAKHWQGPYLENLNIPKDPWGQSYQYRIPGEKNDYELISLGADGRPGGEQENADLVQ